ncbi:MAG: hypothetical protein II395_10635, partial [Ruminococcus sp.]|nr:hypothetical protein [Ruminococcus sp.]
TVNLLLIWRLLSIDTTVKIYQKPIAPFIKGCYLLNQKYTFDMAVIYKIRLSKAIKMPIAHAIIGRYPLNHTNLLLTRR